MTGATLRPESPEGTEEHSRGAQLDQLPKVPESKGCSEPNPQAGPVW